METTRQKRIARLIQKELSDIFQKNQKHNYPNYFISVTIVRISADLSYARIYLSIYPAKSPEEVLKQIKANTSQIKNELAERIRHQVRKIPELEFFIDDSLDYIEHIEDLLKE